MKLLTHYPGQKPLVIDAPLHLKQQFLDVTFRVPFVERLSDNFTHKDLLFAARKLQQDPMRPNDTYPLIGVLQQLADDPRTQEMDDFVESYRFNQ